MTAPHVVDPAGLLGEALSEASPDLIRGLLQTLTRRMDKLVKTSGINALSKSQVSRMAADLDAAVDAFRHRPLDAAGPFTFVAADALTMKVGEGGRVVNAVCLVATGSTVTATVRC